MGKTFAIADIHGRFDLLVQALNAIPQVGKVVMLGDYIDRGPDSAKVVATLREKQSPNFICLTGNHEDMAVQCMQGKAPMHWWRGNGGYETEESYRREQRDLVDDIIWFSGLPIMHVDQHRVFVHAWVDPSRDLDNQDREQVLWKLWGNTWVNHRKSGKHIVHGHHQSEKHPLTINGRTALDTWAVHTGRLAIAVFDDDIPGGPVEIITVQGESGLMQTFREIEDHLHGRTTPYR